jgi:hypothetical protein
MGRDGDTENLNYEQLLSKLHQQNVRHQESKKRWEETLITEDKLLAVARRVINFREYFNKWRNTKEGKAVKAKLLADQEGRCSHCKGSLQVRDENGQLNDHSEFHHLAPLARLQKYEKANPHIPLAELHVFVTDIKYLRLVHPKCNKQLGEQIADLPELDFLRDF